MGNENSIPSKDSIFRPENEHHSLDDSANNVGAARSFREWDREGADFFTAFLLADVEANIQGATAIAKRLGGDMYARIVRDDCAGHFHTIDDDCALGMHVAVQQLMASTKSSIESLHAHVAKCNKREHNCS